MPSNIGSPVQSCPNKSPEKDPVDPEKKWVKFQMKDGDGKPVPNIRVTIVLPDGSREEHISDKDGMIEINNTRKIGQMQIEITFYKTIELHAENILKYLRIYMVF